MTTRHRLVFVMASILPLFLVAMVPVLFSGVASWVILLLAVLASVISIACIWLLTQHEHRLHLIASSVQHSLEAEKENQTDLVDPVQSLATKATKHRLTQTLHELASRVVQRRDSLRANLQIVSQAQHQLNQGQVAEPVMKTLHGPDRTEADQVQQGFAGLAKTVYTVRQRAEVMASFIREHPAATLIVDKQNKLVTMNKAAESLFGYALSSLHKCSISQLFATPHDVNHESYESTMLGFKEGMAELQNKVDRVSMVIKTAQGKCQAAYVSGKFGAHTILSITPRDRIIASDRKVRELHRRSTILQLATILQSQVEQPLEQSQTALNVLFQAAKKSQQRELFSEQIVTARTKLQQPHVFSLLLKWFSCIENNNVPSSESEEVHLKVLTESVCQRVNGLMPNETSKVIIADQGSWVFGDESRVEIILLGLLYHATKSLQEGNIQIKLGRAEGESDDLLSVVLEYKSCPVDIRFATDLSAPFARLESVLLDNKQPGSLLGVYVAKSLLMLMGGMLTVSGLGTNNCKMTAVLPVRPKQEDRIGYDLSNHLHNTTVGEFASAAMALKQEQVPEDFEQSLQHNTAVDLQEVSLTDTQELDAGVLALDDTLGDWKFGN